MKEGGEGRNEGKEEEGDGRVSCISSKPAILQDISEKEDTSRSREKRNLNLQRKHSRRHYKKL